MSLSRRFVLAAAAAAPILAAPAVLRAAAPRKFRIGFNSDRKTTTGHAVYGFGDALAKLSDGRLVIDPYPNNTLGTENEMAKAVSQGALDMCPINVSSIGEISDEVALTDTPYLFKSVAHARSCFDGALGAHCAELLKAKNVIALAFSENGLRHMTAKKPIRAPADLKGLKLRTPPSKVIAESFRAMGAEAEGYPWAQLPEALNAGRFEAQENPLINIIAAKLYQWQSHVSLTGHIYAATILAISGDVWEELSPDDQALMRAAAVEGVKASRAAADQADRDGVAELKSKGMTVVSDIDNAPFQAAAAGPVTARLSELFGADKVKRIRALAS